MARNTGIRWGLVTASALASECVMLVLAIVFRQRQLGEQAVTDMALVASFVLPLLFAIWVGRHAQARFVLNGLLIGAIGILIYELLIVVVSLMGTRPEIPFVYYVAHALKLVGGSVGGAIAARGTRAGLPGAAV